MKKIRLLLTLILSIGLLASCTHSSDDNNTINNAATVGDWKISLFQEDHDETSNFAGYTFNFAKDGAATATKGSTVVTGTWSLREGKFELDFGADDTLRHISDDWIIIEKTESTIKLKDRHPGCFIRLLVPKQFISYE